ncbi:hypothetical protein [Rhizobium leguminosarum]|uniref:hypothetical protein n=1 Tax=Rhizobium leguminosarum TaxID=384 RepID=UPI00143F819B|nr:hypothetical protein [Rhizobium leguminosarum]NKL21770.1 hypothetical protein [Rhizobium leguminosarum bv. viciae]
MKIGDTSSIFSTPTTKGKTQSRDDSAFSALLGSVGDSGSTETTPGDVASSKDQGGLSISGKDADAHQQELVDELHKWANMNPAEMIRAKYLSAHNLSEDALAQLPPDVRQQIEDEIRKQVGEQAKQQGSAKDALSALTV